jgi:hemerythrin superfamily protein
VATAFSLTASAQSQTKKSVSDPGHRKGVLVDEQRDVIEILTHDHREVEQMFAELDSLRGAADEQSRTRRKDVAEQVTIELIRHAVAEEAAVYPKVKEKVSQAEAERALREHAEAERTLKRLEKLRAEDPGFEVELQTLMTEIREHVAEEENEMFPHMRTIFSQEELVKIGQQVEAVKKIAPTRPHPSAPDKPPGNLMVGPVAGLFDRLRDALTHRGTG